MDDKEYIVVPFRPTIKRSAKYGEIALQVHEILNHYVAMGWSYIGIEKIDAQFEKSMQGEAGVSVQVMIFSK